MAKVREIWMHDYWNKNMPNDFFHFSVSGTKLEFQQIGFLMCHFFITFIQKLTQMLILTLFSLILGGLTKKDKRCSISRYKNKKIYELYAFTIKTDFRNVSRSREIGWKSKQNCLNVPNLPRFSQKMILFIEKWWTTMNFLL